MKKNGYNLEKNTLRFNIADIVTEINSSFPMLPLMDIEKRRLENFMETGKSKKTDITINVRVVDEYPELNNPEELFLTRHFLDGNENWRLLKTGSNLIIECPAKGKEHLAICSKSFDKVEMLVLRKKFITYDNNTGAIIPEDEKIPRKINDLIKNHDGICWQISDVVYDFLQILLINHLSLVKKDGAFFHAIGIKDIDGRGLLFAGKSGAGKSTTARIWNGHSRAVILNDDRVIVRKIKKGFFIYGSPWHGDFSDYLLSRIDKARFDKLFLIYHAEKNKAVRVLEQDVFKSLYPHLLPAFWSREGISNLFSFCSELIKKVPCYNMGFKNNKKIIEFVRKIK